MRRLVADGVGELPVELVVEPVDRVGEGVADQHVPGRGAGLVAKAGHRRREVDIDPRGFGRGTVVSPSFGFISVTDSTFALNGATDPLAVLRFRLII
jgi:hypothetical protein